MQLILKQFSTLCYFVYIYSKTINDFLTKTNSSVMFFLIYMHIHILFLSKEETFSGFLFVNIALIPDETHLTLMI